MRSGCSAMYVMVGLTWSGRMAAANVSLVLGFVNRNPGNEPWKALADTKVYVLTSLLLSGMIYDKEKDRLQVADVLN